MRTLSWLTAAWLFLAACGGKTEYSASSTTSEAPAADAAAEQLVELAAPDAAPMSPASRRLVYNAELDLRVEDLIRATGRADSLVRASAGWTQAATQTRSDHEWRQEMTIRVRPPQLTALLAALASLGTIERKNLASEDVTAAHADFTARLRNKRALEQRYLALLQQARKVSDMLEIEEKIGAVREDIEAVESRLKVLNEQVAYSTITLRLRQRVIPAAPVISFGSRLLESLYGGWELAAGLVFGFFYLWPMWLLLVAGWWGVRTWRRR